METHLNSISVRFIQKWIWQHLLCTVCFALLAIWFHSLPFALGIGAGGTWAAVNLLFLKFLIEKYLLERGNVRSFYLSWAILLKFPFLYFLGYCLLKITYLPNESLLIGFSSLFLVVFLKGLNLLWVQK